MNSTIHSNRHFERASAITHIRPTSSTRTRDYLIRNYKYRYAKGNIEGGWILAENRFIKMRSSNTPMNIYGDIQSQKPGDQIWINLFKEIDDLQFWMVKQNSRVSLSHKLHSLGWKYH